MSWDGQERRASEADQSSGRALSERMLRAEWTLNQHSEAIDSLTDTSKRMVEEMSQISDHIKQIKYISTGAAFAVLANEIGLLGLLKGVL